MFHEYAVDPAWLSDAANVRFCANVFGSHSGRWIAKFPKEWYPMIQNHLGDTAAKRLEVMLTTLRECLVRNNQQEREYVTLPEMSWIEKARRVHHSVPFDGIISNEHPTTAGQLTENDLHEQNPRWKVAIDGKVERRASALCGVAEKLLFHSTELRFVDQYFNGKNKHIEPLADFICAARSGRPLTVIQYHLNADRLVNHQRIEIPASEFERALRNERSSLGLQPSERVTFYRWRCHEDGENMHPRFLLTNKGGIRFDHGLDEGRGTTDWSRLSADLWQTRFEQFDPEAQSPVYERVDAWAVTCDEVKRLDWR